MNYHDIIELISCILSFIIPLASIIIAILTLRQNNKMLEANTRPYVVAYLVYEEYSTNIYLCVKNFGQSSAMINSLSISPDILVKETPASSIFKDAMIAPLQQFHFVLLTQEKDRILAASEYSHEITISYVDCTTGKKYTETYNDNIEYVKEVCSSRTTHSNYNKLENSMDNIEKCLQFMKSRNL